MKIKRLLFLGAAMFISTLTFAQSEQATGNQPTDCKTSYSLYRDYLKSWENGSPKYNMKNFNPLLIQHWRNVFLNCPTLKQSTYLDGVKIFTNAYILPTKDETLRNKYIDTLIMIYDKRAEYYPKDKDGSQVGNIMGRKGIDIAALAPDRYEEAYQALKQSIDLDGNDIKNSAFIDSYFGMVIKMAKGGKIEESAILDEYSRLMDIVNFNIKKYTDVDEKQFNNYNATKTNLDAAVEPYANCEDLVRIYRPKFDADPNNPELLTKIATMLDKKRCDDDPLYLEVAINMHKLNPSPESAYMIGKRYLINKDYSSAINYLEQATKSENIEWAESSYKYLAQIMLTEKNYAKGREYARKAISLNKSDGEPYIVIGLLYAASAKDCGTGDFYSKTAFWAAVDQFQKAKSVDPSIAAKANEQIAVYSQYFPTVESIFFNGFEEGKQFTVECWINETTTVRAAK